MRPALLAAPLLLAAGCGGSLLHADLEVEEARLTLPAQRFPASSAPPPAACALSTSSCVATDLTYDLGQQLDVLERPATAYEIRLTALDLALAATQGGGDLGGVTSAAVLAYPPGGGPAVELARYQRPPGTSAPTSIAASSTSGLDLAPYLDAGLIRLRVELGYDRPTPAFEADVTASFYLKVKLDYGALL